MIEDKKRKHRNKPNRMNDAEIMAILSCLIPVDFDVLNIITKSTSANI